MPGQLELFEGKHFGILTCPVQFECINYYFAFPQVYMLMKGKVLNYVFEVGFWIFFGDKLSSCFKVLRGNTEYFPNIVKTKRCESYEKVASAKR